MNIVLAESDIKTLTLEASVDLAINNNYRIRNAEAEIQKNKLIRQRTSDNLDFVDIGNPIDDYRSTMGLSQIDLRWRMSQKELELLKDHIAFEVKSTYNEVLQAKANLEFLSMVVEQAKMQNMVQQTQLGYGTISNYQNQQSKNSYKEAQERYNLAQKALEHAYEKLNDLLGISKDDRRELVDAPTWEPIEDQNIERLVTAVKENSTSVWLAQQQVNIAKMDLSMYIHYDLYTNIPNSTPYDAKKIEVQQAENNVADTQKQLETIIRSTYNKLQQLEQQYLTLAISLDKTLQDYELIKIKCDVGMAIPLELVSAKLAVEQIKTQMNDIIIQHDNLKIGLEKPWLLGGR